ncbi:hypothetical protein [Streptomyces sp. 8N706]|uniref:hypothetical protein n=1 Tax=Streptomyces sp. 8N706 TaxID=3457416 RepID=UPI003FD60EE1
MTAFEPTPQACAAAARAAVLTDFADLHGRFADGYSADGIRTVFGRIHDEGGPYLVCVWDYADDFGFGGNSVFYVEDEDGGLFEVQPDIHRWLSGQQETPGPLNTWTGARAYETEEFPVSDDFHNYARSDRPDHTEHLNEETTVTKKPFTSPCGTGCAAAQMELFPTLAAAPAAPPTVFVPAPPTAPGPAAPFPPPT